MGISRASVRADAALFLRYAAKGNGRESGERDRSRPPAFGYAGSAYHQQREFIMDEIQTDRLIVAIFAAAEWMRMAPADRPDIRKIKPVFDFVRENFEAQGITAKHS